jgi:hypothetical protein
MPRALTRFGGVTSDGWTLLSGRARAAFPVRCSVTKPSALLLVIQMTMEFKFDNPRRSGYNRDKI